MSKNTIRKIAKKIKTDSGKLSLILQPIPTRMLDRKITRQNYRKILKRLEKIDEELLEGLVLILERGAEGDPYKTRKQKDFIVNIAKEIKIQFVQTTK